MAGLASVCGGSAGDSPECESDELEAALMADSEIEAKLAHTCVYR